MKRLWKEQPLSVILFAGAFFRLIAAIFSKGWGMHDDHFLVIEAAQSILDGADYNNWIPDDENDTPGGHSFFYPGIHYFLFWIMDSMGFTNPQGKMYVIRFLHAAYSMITIVLGYRITLRLASQKIANQVGLVLALLWIFPILSVKNLVEVVCIPPLMYSTYLLLKNKENPKLGPEMLAGFFAGIAMGIRFQTALFIGGFGLYLLFNRRWAGAVLFGVLAAVGFSLTQIGDVFIWDRPFAEFQEYIRYNIEHKTSYFNRPWYMYFLTIGGLLIPPISLFWMFGFARLWKKHLLIFLPAFIFFAFHSYFPNKQERFIIPVLPFLIILGHIGWTQFTEQSKFWSKNGKLHRGFWIWFWSLNTILLLVLSASYTKRNRVESMTWLYNQEDFNNMIIESSHQTNFLMPAQYYTGTWKKYFYITSKSHPAEQVRQTVDQLSDSSLVPNYVVFFEEVKLEERIERFETNYGKELELAVVIEPSFIDDLLFKLNPNNDNQTTYIYRIEQ